VEPALLAWFSEHGRDLPWRGTQDPYAILVSEVMLQQTQVERVIPRYLAWLERWPTVTALAAAPAADVIREWQGLGYNRRGHRFSPAAGQALMDLGATVCLARVPRCGICPLASACPSQGRRYEPLRKQSRFEGSFRQRRAQTLRLVAESERPLRELDHQAVESLAQDGLVHVAPCGTLVTLP
jgi:adenine-specific DNA glycosylase